MCTIITKMSFGKNFTSILSTKYLIINTNTHHIKFVVKNTTNKLFKQYSNKDTNFIGWTIRLIVSNSKPYQKIISFLFDDSTSYDVIFKYDRFDTFYTNDIFITYISSKKN